MRALLGHVVVVVTMLAHIGAGGDSSDVPDRTDRIADDGWAGALRQARADTERVWADDAVLDRTVVLPWATLSGRAAPR